MDNRIEWIDIAKGIGIILVIAGHCFCLGYSYPLYAFHMPLFFFLSGLLFKDKNEGFVDFFKSKTNSLMRPWLIILFISFLVCLAIPQWRNEITLTAVLSDLYTANTNVFQNSSLWYLVCFYFMLIIFYFVSKIKRTAVSAIIFIIIAIGLLWIKEMLNLSNLPFQRLPFKIDSALIALVFFYVAYLYKDKILSFMKGKANLLLVVFIVVVTAILSVYNGGANINALIFGKIRLLYYPVALLGIASVCLLSQWISSSNAKKVKFIISFFGRNSLIIFGFQGLLIRLYLLLFNNIESLSMAWLNPSNPYIHQAGSFLFVTFIASPIVVECFVLLRKKGVKII